MSFQADFNGTGTGSGTTGNIATFGGTASLSSSSTLVSSIATPPSGWLSGATGVLQLSDTGGGGGNEGILITPASAAHTPDAWFSTGSSHDTVNGAMDFFFSDSVGSSGWTNSGSDFRPIDISGGNGGLRMVINCPTTNELQVDFSAKNSSGSYVQHIYAADYSVNVTASTLYHLAVTVATNPTSGLITVNLYLAPGNVTINPASSTYLIGTATTSAALSDSGSNAITTAFGTSSGFTFGQQNNPSDSKTLKFGSLRVYNAVPVLFNGVNYLPPLAVTTPSGNPTLPSSFDTFTPPFSANAAAGNTPAMAEWTRTANPGDGLALSGNNFSTYAASSANFGKDTSFVTYGQASNSVISPVTQAAIRRLSTDGTSAAALELDSSLPSSSMYLIWPTNANGAGAPIVVNQAEAWWLGPNIASSSTACFAAGQPISVYGRNLALGTSITPEVWIQQSGASSGVAATVSTYSPYKIDFTIPSSLSNGTTYQVWVHNGHGGTYGWSLCPQSLVLTAPISWTGTTYTVPAATGVPATDTANVESKLSAAGGAATSSVGTTVSFPAGTYAINASLTLPANVRMVGAGSSSTILQASANGINMVNVSGTNASISNLELNGGSSTVDNTYLLHGSATNSAGQGSYFTNIAFVANGNSSQQMVYMGPCQNTFYENCTFTGRTICPSVSYATQLFFDHCTMNMMYDSIAINLGGWLNGFSITNCSVGNNGTWKQEVLTTNTAVLSTSSNNVTLATVAGMSVGDTVYDNSGVWYDTIGAINTASNVITLNDPITGAPQYPTKADGSGTTFSVFTGTNVGQGLFVKGLNNTAERINLYYGNNTTTNFADPCSIDNWGEVISFEGNIGDYYGTPTSIAGNTMTFPSSGAGSMSGQGFTTSGLNLLAVITSGTGMGQTRVVSSYSLSGNTVTVATPWNLNPDSTSIVVIGAFASNVAIYKNSLDGESYFAQKDENRHGGVLSAGTTQMVIDGNTMTCLDSGMDVNGQGQRDESTSGLLPGNHMQPEYFDVVTNNTINQCFTGISLGGGGETGSTSFPAVAAVYNFGQIYRDNTVSNSYVSGVLNYTTSQPSGTIPTDDMLLLDGNSFTACPAGIFFTDQGGSSFNPTQQGSTIATGNTFNMSGAVNPGTVPTFGNPYGYGIFWTNRVSLLTALDDNTYSNFSSSNYNSVTLGAVLEEPLRSFTEYASKTLAGSVTDSLELWNDGTSSLGWTVTVAYDDSSSGWLSTSPSSGTIPSEDAVSMVSFTCNSSALTAGTYTAHITASCGSQTRTAQVVLVVGP